MKYQIYLRPTLYYIYDMIINDIIDIKNINIKKHLYYSSNYTFVPIKYNQKDLIIQTPKLYTKYGIIDYFDKSSIVLSLQNITNDNNICIFKNNLELIFNKIPNKYNNCEIIDYLEKLDMRYKVSQNILLYDSSKKILNNIPNNSYGNYIIHLSGFWIIDKCIHFQWHVLQAKIDIPIILKQYAFININIPKPPPLPNFCKKEHKIKIVKKKKKQIHENKIEPPSLDEIQKALNKLKKIKI